VASSKIVELQNDGVSQGSRVTQTGQRFPAGAATNDWREDSSFASLNPMSLGISTSVMVRRNLEAEIERLITETTAAIEDPSASANGTFVSDLRAPVISGPVFRKGLGFKKDRTLPLATWEGIVERRNVTSFLARVALIEHGITNIDSVEYTEFDIDEVSETEFQSIQPGATFYWSVGRRRNEAGTVTNFSFVRFRRLPKISVLAKRIADSDIEEISESS
jgi:hypothetical protein